MHKIKKSQVWISFRFLRFFSDFPSSNRPGFDAVSDLSYISLVFLFRPGLSREPPADQEQTAAGSLRNPTARHDLTKSESNNTARQGQPESGPGTTVEVPNQRRTQPEPKPILTERCKTRLKALLCNHGKNIHETDKTRLKSQIQRYRSI